jgi:hypothetical protein
MIGQPLAAPSNTSTLRLVTISCPKCASRDGRSIEAIYCEYKTPTQSQQTITAELSQRSAPPGRRHPVYWIALACFLSVTAIAVARYSAPTSSALLISVAMCVWMARDADRYNVFDFPRLAEYWHRAFMCERCGEVFVPTAGSG